MRQLKHERENTICRRSIQIARGLIGKHAAWPARQGSCNGNALANLLRQCHAYVSASRHEPGAMHPVEGVQCGLPLLYHSDSGGTVGLGERYGLCLSEDAAESMKQMRESYAASRKDVLESPPSGDLMCLEYRRLIQREIALAPQS